jgi:hypothetical protein
MTSRLFLVATAALSLTIAACTDSVKLSEEKAQAHAERLAKLTSADVNEIRTGLPDGAKRLATALFEGADKQILPDHARAVLKKTREQVPTLQLAKSTFFTVTDPTGVALASDQESDGFVGKNLFTALPGLAKAKDGKLVETNGQLDEARGVKSGDDAVWAAAAPVVGADGAQKGFYVTGWSMRRYAEHLERQMQSDLRNDASKEQKPSKMPLLYVFAVMGDKAYGTPVSPDVNMKAIEDLKLSSKLQGDAVWHSRIEITNREYGVAAKKAPDLCDTCAVAVLRSEI